MNGPEEGLSPIGYSPEMLPEDDMDGPLPIEERDRVRASLDDLFKQEEQFN